MPYPDILANGTDCGFNWHVVHNGIGYRCGYIDIPASHPWYSRDMDYLSAAIRVHGGITYHSRGRGRSPPNYLTIGFDCAHMDDAPDLELTPHAINFYTGGIVRSTDFCISECVEMCRQAYIAANTDTSNANSQS